MIDPSKRITIPEIKADSWFRVNNETPSLSTLTSLSDPTPPPSFQSIIEEDAERDTNSNNNSTNHSREDRERERIGTNHSSGGETDDQEDTLPHVVINGLTVTNAFDLIALSGVMGKQLSEFPLQANLRSDMTRMLSPLPPEEQIMRYTKWSSVASADVLLSRLAGTLKQLGIEHTVRCCHKVLLYS